MLEKSVKNFLLQAAGFKRFIGKEFNPRYQISLRNKIRMWSNGFCSDSYIGYGLNKNPLKNYLTDFQMYFMLGNANQKLGKHEEAVKYFRRLIIYHGLNIDVLNCLASCYYHMGEIQEAKRAWEQSLKVDPKQEKVKKALKGLKNEN